MTTPPRPYRALLVLTAAPAEDAHGSDPWSVFTTEGWTVDITCIAGRSPGPQIPAVPLPAPLDQLDTPGQPDLDGAHHDSADYDSADYDSADYDSADYDSADLDWADLDWADLDWAESDCADYDIVCFVDGHTTTWAAPRNPDLSRLLSRISEYGKVIAAVRPAALDSLQEFSLRDR
jgi:putative intracellular protease/amidase